MLSGCAGEPDAEMPPIPVRVAAVESRTVTVSRDFAGELVPARYVTVLARASGILLRQHVPDGALITEGALLFTIDAEQALERRDAARAELSAARAQQARAQADVARYEPLLEDEAIARQIFDNARAAAEAATAKVEAREAMLRQAEIQIGYSEVRAPLSGRMGAAQVSEGGLVTASSTALVDVAVEDPLWVYVSPSETDLLAYLARERDRGDPMDSGLTEATLLLSDGRQYPLKGQINFTDRALDPATATYRIRAEFANPERKLLAGQVVRVRLQTNVYPDAIVVPARAVIQVLDQAFVAVLNPDQTLQQRPVRLGPRIDSDWIIESGLEAGETIVVDGAAKVRPGSRVQPLPAASPS
jgi:membrane fusion protein (multidrug efflux system)